MSGHLFQIHFLVLSQLHEMGTIIPIVQIRKLRLGEIRKYVSSPSHKMIDLGFNPKVSQASSPLHGSIRGPSLFLSVFILPTRPMGALSQGTHLQATKYQLSPAQAQLSPEQGDSVSVYEAVSMCVCVCMCMNAYVCERALQVCLSM